MNNLKYLPIIKSDLRHVALVNTVSCPGTIVVALGLKPYTVHHTLAWFVENYKLDWNIVLFWTVEDASGKLYIEQDLLWVANKCTKNQAIEAAYFQLDKIIEKLNPRLKKNAGFALTRYNGVIDIEKLVEFDKDFFLTDRVYSTKENYHRVLK